MNSSSPMTRIPSARALSACCPRSLRRGRGWSFGDGALADAAEALDLFLRVAALEMREGAREHDALPRKGPALRSLLPHGGAHARRIQAGKLGAVFFIRKPVHDILRRLFADVFQFPRAVRRRPQRALPCCRNGARGRARRRSRCLRCRARTKTCPAARSCSPRSQRGDFAPSFRRTLPDRKGRF